MSACAATLDAWCNTHCPHAQDGPLVARLGAASDAYQAWEDEMEASVAADDTQSLVVIEIGCRV